MNTPSRFQTDGKQIVRDTILRQCKPKSCVVTLSENTLEHETAIANLPHAPRVYALNRDADRVDTLRALSRPCNLYVLQHSIEDFLFYMEAATAMVPTLVWLDYCGTWAVNRHGILKTLALGWHPQSEIFVTLFTGTRSPSTYRSLGFRQTPTQEKFIKRLFSTFRKEAAALGWSLTACYRYRVEGGSMITFALFRGASSIYFKSMRDLDGTQTANEIDPMKTETPMYGKLLKLVACARALGIPSAELTKNFGKPNRLAGLGRAATVRGVKASVK